MRDATIEQSAEPKDPDNADTLPPPGAGEVVALEQDPNAVTHAEWTPSFTLPLDECVQSQRDANDVKYEEQEEEE